MARESTVEKSLFDFSFTLKNTIICLLATVILLFISAILATYLAMSEPIVDALVAVVTGICVLWSGFRAARHIGRQGLLCGIIAGVIYMLLVYFIGSLVFGDLVFDATTALSMVIGIGCGAIGGMIGVNAKSKRRRK